MKLIINSTFFESEKKLIFTEDPGDKMPQSSSQVYIVEESWPRTQDSKILWAGLEQQRPEECNLLQVQFCHPTYIQSSKSSFSNLSVFG